MDGKIIVNNGCLLLKLNNKKSYKLNINLPKKLSWEDIDGREIYEDEYLLSNEKIDWIIIDDVKIQNKISGEVGDRKNTWWQKNEYKQQPERSSILTIPATSPYNFVPLNEVIVSAEDLIPFDRYTDGRHTGYIEVNIKNLTPIFIRNEKESEDFFKINGKDAIPGSSIRGLIRMMVEILSFGKFENFDDTKHFMRFIADKKGRSYKTHYYTKMGLDEDGVNNIVHNAKAGFLFFNGANDSYSVYPSTGKLDRIPHDNNKEFEHVWRSSKNGWDLFSGKMKKGETYKRQWFIPSAYDPKPMLIDENVIHDYSNDKNRNTGSLDILKLARTDVGTVQGKKYPVGVPVFYTESDGKITSIGHTKNYRLPYDNYTSDLVPKKKSSPEQADFAQRIFGDAKKQEICGRVFFEDAIIDELKGNYLHKMPKILSGPKPTSFQLYLEQNGHPKSYNINEKEHVHWDTKDAKIRGYKIYWHRLTTKDDEYAWFDKSYEPGNVNANKISTQSSRIKAIPEGNTFIGRIRFENLTELELGALLTAIELPGINNGCHKIGMGKPLGLGTVKLTANLFLSDRKKRYSLLFNADGSWAEPTNEQATDFKKVFTDFILKEVDTSKTSIWDIDRLVHLKTMLEFDADKVKSKEWLERTSYMKIRNDNKENEFKNRNVLPNPTEVNDLYLDTQKK